MGAELVVLVFTAAFIFAQAVFMCWQTILLRGQVKNNEVILINSRQADYYVELLDYIGVFLDFIHYWENTDTNKEYSKPYEKMLSRRDIVNFEARRLLVTGANAITQDAVAVSLYNLSVLEDNYIYRKPIIGYPIQDPIARKVCLDAMNEIIKEATATKDILLSYKTIFIDKLQHLNTIKR